MTRLLSNLNDEVRYLAYIGHLLESIEPMSAFSFDPFAESLFQLGRRVTALSFIGLILIGNVWVIYKFTGESAPAWSA
jgi:hypothetical protein